MTKKLYILVLSAICIFYINSSAFASKANDCMYVAKQKGLVKDIKLSNRLVYVDGDLWKSLPYETKQTFLYCFAGYMSEKKRGEYVDVKDYNSGEKYAHGGPLGSQIYK